MTRLIIFANGMVPDLTAARACVRPDDVLIAADGGTRLAFRLGWMPSKVFGDLDSLAPADRQRLDAQNVEIRQFPREKDETDLELALDYARTCGLKEIVIMGGLGGRLDQTLGNLALLTDARLADLDTRMEDGMEEAFFVRSQAVVRGNPGEIVSLIAWGSPVLGVRTSGLRWPLRGETLLPERTRGVSNELQEGTAGIEIASGLLLCVHRHAAGSTRSTSAQNFNPRRNS